MKERSRSSILKLRNSPLKEQQNQNEPINKKKSTDRRSSSRRVSFARTHHIKEYPDDCITVSRCVQEEPLKGGQDSSGSFSLHVSAQSVICSSASETAAGVHVESVSEQTHITAFSSQNVTTNSKQQCNQTYNEPRMPFRERQGMLPADDQHLVNFHSHSSVGDIINTNEAHSANVGGDKAKLMTWCRQEKFDIQHYEVVNQGCREPDTKISKQASMPTSLQAFIEKTSKDSCDDKPCKSSELSIQSEVYELCRGEKYTQFASPLKMLPDKTINVDMEETCVASFPAEILSTVDEERRASLNKTSYAVVDIDETIVLKESVIRRDHEDHQLTCPKNQDPPRLLQDFLDRTCVELHDMDQTWVHKGKIVECSNVPAHENPLDFTSISEITGGHSVSNKNAEKLSELRNEVHEIRAEVGQRHSSTIDAKLLDRSRIDKNDFENRLMNVNPSEYRDGVNEDKRIHSGDKENFYVNTLSQISRMDETSPKDFEDVYNKTSVDIHGMEETCVLPQSYLPQPAGNKSGPDESHVMEMTCVQELDFESKTKEDILAEDNEKIEHYEKNLGIQSQSRDPSPEKERKSGRVNNVQFESATIKREQTKNDGLVDLENYPGNLKQHEFSCNKYDQQIDKVPEVFPTVYPAKECTLENRQKGLHQDIPFHLQSDQNRTETCTLWLSDKTTLSFSPKSSSTKVLPVDVLHSYMQKLNDVGCVDVVDNADSDNQKNEVALSVPFKDASRHEKFIHKFNQTEESAKIAGDVFPLAAALIPPNMPLSNVQVNAIEPSSRADLVKSYSNKVTEQLDVEEMVPSVENRVSSKQPIMPLTELQRENKLEDFDNPVSSEIFDSNPLSNWNVSQLKTSQHFGNCFPGVPNEIQPKSSDHRNSETSAKRYTMKRDIKSVMSPNKFNGLSVKVRKFDQPKSDGFGEVQDNQVPTVTYETGDLSPSELVFTGKTLGLNSCNPSQQRNSYSNMHHSNVSMVEKVFRKSVKRSSAMIRTFDNTQFPNDLIKNKDDKSVSPKNTVTESDKEEILKPTNLSEQQFNVGHLSIELSKDRKENQINEQSYGVNFEITNIPYPQDKKATCNSESVDQEEVILEKVDEKENLNSVELNCTVNEPTVTVVEDRTIDTIALSAKASEITSNIENVDHSPDDIKNYFTESSVDVSPVLNIDNGKETTLIDDDCKITSVADLSDPIETEMLPTDMDHLSSTRLSMSIACFKDDIAVNNTVDNLNEVSMPNVSCITLPVDFTHLSDLESPDDKKMSEIVNSACFPVAYVNSSIVDAPDGGQKQTADVLSSTRNEDVDFVPPQDMDFMKIIEDVEKPSNESVISSGSSDLKEYLSKIKDLGVKLEKKIEDMQEQDVKAKVIYEELNVRHKIRDVDKAIKENENEVQTLKEKINETRKIRDNISLRRNELLNNKYLAWKLKTFADNKFQVSFLHDHVELDVEFEPKSKSDCKEDRKITINDRLMTDVCIRVNDKIEGDTLLNFGILMFTQWMESNDIHNKYVNRRNISELLDDVSMVALRSKHLVKELRYIDVRNPVQIINNSVKFTISSFRLHAKFTVIFDVPPLDKYPSEKAELSSLTSIIGNKSREDIIEVIKDVSCGLHYIQRCYSCIENYLRFPNDFIKSV